MQSRSTPAGKRPVNLTLSEDVVNEARNYTANLSATVEDLLVEYVAGQRQARESQQEQARRLCEEWNEFDAQYGSFADEHVNL
ncbi:type II toxin-antitoxin system CcdA family antitoxin [Ramlibacter albus]|uniref:Type II toxin-antitoxin system CcdA family antitoxin n=1 Tax=Ramlibacter albus TaxID=2079448 RepID=A0A923M728_9BURK|nr:type II toxin-antitoxin system CcdA family antitoxin [Ramlibacter albus]MBC5765180.1 type II toxin-antitoxin system CcdA family antitoxin [Ramlibacter albus]